MRLKFKGKIKDHSLLADVNPNDHHLQGNYVTIIENGFSIGPGDYQRRIVLGNSGYKTIRANLRGSTGTGIIGHCGALVIGSDVARQSIGLSSSYSSYVYMGCFNRLHGDSRLSNIIFGNSIWLKDVYIDGSDAVLLFNNSTGYNQILVVYGTIVVK